MMTLNDKRVQLDADKAVSAYWRKQQKKRTDMHPLLKTCLWVSVIVTGCIIVGASCAFVVIIH